MTQQKLQRKIASYRGIAPDAALVSPTQSSVEDGKSQDAVKSENQKGDGREPVTMIVTKRKYRRHPKVNFPLLKSPNHCGDIGND